MDRDVPAGTTRAEVEASRPGPIPSSLSGTGRERIDPAAVAARTPATRGSRARQRILRAALTVLADEGLPGFSMEAVARAAGASKTTLYRRWPSAGALLVDAMDATFRPFPTPVTGHLPADLAELLTGQADLLQHTAFPRLMAAFIDAAEREPALAALHGDLTHRRRQPVLSVLAQARDRGQIPAQTDLELATDLLTAPFFYRRFIAHRSIPPELISEVVQAVLTAIGYQETSEDAAVTAEGGRGS